MVNINGLISKNANFLLEKGNFTLEKPLSYKNFFNGYITAQNRDADGNLIIGVFDENKTHIPNTGIQDLTNNCNIKKLTTMKDPLLCDETVVYIGAFSGIWGHFITDSIRMLWFLTNQKFDKLRKYKMCYIGWANFRLKGQFRSVLEHLGIDCDNLIEIKDCTQFKEIIIPDSSFVHTPNSIKISKEYGETIMAISNNSTCTKSIYKKVFLSTSKLKKKNSYGEKKLDTYFRKRGFKIVHPQKLSFDEQLSIYKNCEIFASTDGSAMHNSVFCNENTKLIIIPRGNYCTWYQAAINYVKNFDCYYIDSSLSVFTQQNKEWEGPFYFYISDNLRKFFNDNKAISIRKNFYDIDKYFKESLYKKILPQLEGNDYINAFFSHYSSYIRSNPFYKIKMRLKNALK